MSLQQFSDDHHRATADTAVRVFPALVPTPRSLEPRRWNNPAGALLIGMPLSIGLTWIPWLLPALGGLAMLISQVLAHCAAMGYFVRPESRTNALMDGAWVARPCGYHGEELPWQDEHGTLKHAASVRGNTGWNLILTDRSVVGASSV